MKNDICMERLGRNCLVLRKFHKITKVKAAKNLDCSLTNLFKLETGNTKNPSVLMLVRICALYNIELENLIFHDIQRAEVGNLCVELPNYKKTFSPRRLGRNCKALRQLKRLDRKTLATKISCSPPTIQSIESGVIVRSSLRTVNKLSKFFGVSLSDFLFKDIEVSVQVLYHIPGEDR